MIEGLRLPEGLTGRASTADDIDDITTLIAAAEVEYDGEVVIDRTDVEQSIRQATVDPPGSVVVHEEDRLVGWAAIHGQRTEVGVLPSARGCGIGTALLAWAEATLLVTGVPRARQTVTDADEAAHRILAAHGYRHAHTSWILELPLAAEPPTVTVPDGIAIRAFLPTDERATYRVIDDAFNEWEGREPVTFEAWADIVTRHPAFSASLSRLAFDGDELVGVAIAYDYPDQDDGWVQQLATKASHRHRGIARALLASVFGAFHERGRRSGGLSTDSRTGALTLYEHLGMRVKRSYTAWARDLA